MQPLRPGPGLLKQDLHFHRPRGPEHPGVRQAPLEILERGLVPFYCCAWSNVASARNAIRSGFRPAWVQVTAKPLDDIQEMNR